MSSADIDAGAPAMPETGPITNSIDSANSAADASAPMPSVVIIDDDRSLLGLLSAVFAEASFEVRAFANARSALSQVIEANPDVIVLDLEMPEMNGREFFTAVRAEGVMTPVLILSAHGARQARQELGAEAHLDKPFEPDALVFAARSLVA